MAAMGAVTALLSSPVVPGALPISHNNLLLSGRLAKSRRVCNIRLNRTHGTLESIRALECESVSLGIWGNAARSTMSRNAVVQISATAGEMAVEEPKVQEPLPVTERIEESEASSISGASTESADAGVEENAASSNNVPRRKITTKRGGAQKRKVTVKMEDLQLGQELPGKVRTLTTYGAFVDIGSSTDGLVHISEISNGFVKDIGDVVTVGQEVTVRVLEVDITKGRIGLSMRDRAAEAEAEAERGAREDDLSSRSRAEAVDETGRPINRAKIAGSGAGRRQDRKRDDKPTHGFRKGQTVQGVVTKIGDTGASIELKEGVTGMLYRESIPYDEDANGEAVPSIKVGQTVEVQIARLEKNNRISVTMKEEEVDLKALNAQLNTADSEKTMNAFERAFRLARLVKDAPKPELETAAAVESSTSEQLETSAETPAAEEIPVESTQKIEAPSEVEVPAQTPEMAAVADVPEAAAVSETTEVAPLVETAEVAAVAETMEVVAETEELAPLVEATEVAALAETTEVETSEAPAVAKPEEVAPVVEAPEVAAVAETTEVTSAAEIPEVVAPEVQQPLAQPEVKIPVVVASTSEPAVQKQAPTGGISAAAVKQLREETGAGMMDCKKALVESEGDIGKARDFLRKKGLASADKKASRVVSEGVVTSYIHDNRIGVLLEVNCETDFVSRGERFRELVSDLAMQVAACPEVEFVETSDIDPEFLAKEREIEMGKEDLLKKPEAIRSKIVDGRVSKRMNELALVEQPYIRDDKMLVKDLVKSTVASLGENIKVRRFIRFNLGEGLKKKQVDFAAEVAAQTQAKEAPTVKVVEAPTEVVEIPKVAVSPALVKELREATGAGMMDCKKALAQNDNDVAKATEFLRKKGLASAEKKSGRTAAEGIVGSYIHDNRIGVLIEVNCETDFVARGEKFRSLVQDLAMQVAACPQVQYVDTTDVPEDFVAKEREIEMGKEDLLSKPEAKRGLIVDGRMAKRLKELALAEQPYIRQTDIDVKTLVKQTIAELGENIQVRRFARFNLGEGIEKKKVDFAAEVAAQTGSKA